MRRERLLLNGLCVFSVLVIVLLLVSHNQHFSFVPVPLADFQLPLVVPHQTDMHVSQMENARPRNHRRTLFPARQNMSACRPLFGKVAIFVAYVQNSMETHYAVARRSLECYLKSTPYPIFMVDLDNDARVKQACYNNKQLFFRKHCAAAAYLQEADWLFVLDADTGVVNPNHCIEKWIDDRVDLIFYERFFNWEIASGNYIARNTDFSQRFLKKWADWEFMQPSNWNGADNGVLQMHVLQTVLPNAQQESRVCGQIWRLGTDYDTYMAYATCVNKFLGATRIWPGKLRILRRGHGWVRDGFLIGDEFSELDFMFHGWKAQNVGDSGWQSPFTKNLDPAECGSGLSGWRWRPDMRIPMEKIKKKLADYEKSSGRNFPQKARVFPYLAYQDIGGCYPHCDYLV